MWIVKTLLGLSLSASFQARSAPIDSCSALIGSCEYYACVEQERISCGPQGYPIGYGVNYCEKLSALEFRSATTTIGELTFPADGNQWRDEVRTCLQVEMDDFFKSGEEVTCKSLKAFAFNSHSKCYTQSPSFCELTVESVLKVGLTISPKDLLTPESINQVATTAGICSLQITERLNSERNLLVRLNLRKYRIIWDAIASDPSKVNEHLDTLKQRD